MRTIFKLLCFALTGLFFSAMYSLGYKRRGRTECISLGHHQLRLNHHSAAQFVLLCLSSPSGEEEDMSVLLPALLGLLL